MLLIDLRVMKCGMKLLILFFYLILFLIDVRLKMYEKNVSGDFFMLKYCHDRCKAQEMCDKTIDDFLLALKFAPDSLFTSEMIEKLQTDLFVDDNLLFF